MNTWFIIINPVACAGKARAEWTRIAKELTRQNISYEHAFTTHKGDATTIVQMAAEKGFRYIASAGGDGTLHEVVNGVMQQTVAPSHQFTIGILPIGTGNDWIKSHKLPKSWRKMIPLLMAQKSKVHDVGICDYTTEDGYKARRYFVNVAGIAYDAYVTRASNLVHRPSFLPGRVFYSGLIFKCLAQYKPYPLRVTWDGQSREGKLFSLNAGICSFNGGGANFCPHAVSDDGLLAFTIVGEVSKMDVVKSTHLIYNGKILSHPLIDGYSTDRISLEHLGEHAIPLEADGEYLGVSPMSIGILKHAINVICA